MRNDIILACQLHAAANPSDPFAYSRAMAHAKSGIGYKDGQFTYDSTPTKVTRTVIRDGVTITYDAVEYRDQKVA